MPCSVLLLSRHSQSRHSRPGPTLLRAARSMDTWDRTDVKRASPCPRPEQVPSGQGISGPVLNLPEEWLVQSASSVSGQPHGSALGEGVAEARKT